MLLKSLKKLKKHMLVYQIKIIVQNTINMVMQHLKIHMEMLVGVLLMEEEIHLETLTSEIFLMIYSLADLVDHLVPLEEAKELEVEKALIRFMV